MKIHFAKWMVCFWIMAIAQVQEVCAENLLFTAWQPRFALLEMVPTGELKEGVHPFPGLHFALHTPYADIAGTRWQAFAECGYVYWAAASGQNYVNFDVHIVRLLAGFAMPLPAAHWILARAGLGYHYLRGNRIGGEASYAFIEDGESEMAWHLGLTLEPPTPYFHHVFLTGGFDGIPTLPRITWVGMLALGYRW
jgi:hypothetical protein